MIRPSNAFVIFKKDLKSGKATRKHYDNLIEYWIYRQKESDIVDSTGKKVKLEGRNNSYLHCIIVCEGSHITKETEKGILINGVRFTEKDMENYLHKTGRSRA